MSSFSCKVVHRHRYSEARITQISTPHGLITTPVFMPVGTRAGVNNLTIAELLATKSQIILGGNTYHMLCSPGMKVIEAVGGMHPFMGWHGPMLTDSGGFQVFSLAKNQCTIDDKGAHFKLPAQDNLIHMTPEMSLQTQKIIGADIIMAFDQCTPDTADFNEAKLIMQRTHRWLRQSLEYHQRYPTSRYGHKQALFGIIQGGAHLDLRLESTKFVTSLDLDGIAIGGESVGFNMPVTIKIIQEVMNHLPVNKPRYTMGVGMSPQDLIDVVKEGIDMFDCVAPTRNARHGALYCGEIVVDNHWLRFESIYPNARIQIKKAVFAKDDTPIMAHCRCYTCLHHSRAYLHYLFKKQASAFTALASIHNIHVMHEVCNRMRELIMHQSLI